MIAMTESDRKMWAGFVRSVLRAARDVGSLAFLQEPDAASLVPEGEPRRVVATALPDEGLVRVYLRLPAAPGQPQQMAHLGDLHESGEWKTGTQRITPKGPAH
jgi:hypothetical protein